MPDHLPSTSHEPFLAAHTKSHSALLAAVLFLLAILPFLPAVHGEFTWDDNLLLTDSPQVRAINGLRLIWNPLVQPIQYFPLTYTSFWFEHQLWGFNRAELHIVNMLLHAGASVLLWLALRRLKVPAAWFAALLWAIHPVQVESVAWISERKNTLSGLFYMLSAWAYLRFARIGDPPAPTQDPPTLRWPWYLLACVALLAALLSKTLVCTLPAALAVILWWKREKITRRDLLSLIPLFALSLGIAFITAFEEHRNMVVGGANDLVFSFPQRLIIFGKNVCFYWRTLLLPYPLMPVYPRWTYDASRLFNYLPAAAALSIPLALFAARRQLGKAPLAACLFFLITLSPLLGFLNFFTMHYSFVADHYQYLACLGLLIPAVVAFHSVLLAIASRISTHGFTRHLVVGLCGAVVIAALACLSAFYASLFQSNMKLWTWNVNHNPNAFIAQHNLGMAFLNAGLPDQGLRHIQLALAQQPNDDSLQRTAGRIARDNGLFPQAIEHLQRAIALRPHFGLSYKLLGDVYDRQHDTSNALAAYDNAIAVDNTDPLFFLADAEELKKARQFSAAAKMYESAIALAPGNLITRYNYANLLLDLNRPNDAIAQYEFILKYQDDPHNGPIWHNLAYAFSLVNQHDNAVAAETRARSIDAANAQLPPSPFPIPPPP